MEKSAPRGKQTLYLIKVTEFVSRSKSDDQVCGEGLQRYKFSHQLFKIEKQNFDQNRFSNVMFNRLFENQPIICTQ